jgi:adenosylcobinamide kinase/adenosylcobinamide-phosphate guanylyltransferase
VLGGARSGKSSFALKRAEKDGTRRAFVATAEARDEEMAERIKRHRAERANRWSTYEEPLNLTRLLTEIADSHDVYLIDCITLWVSNLMAQGLQDEEIINKTKELSRVCVQMKDCSVYVVSNEVGLSVVPENPLARRFRDLTGRVNQILAEAAEEVYFIISGLPQRIK